MKIKHQRIVAGRVPTKNAVTFARRSGKPKPSSKSLQRSFQEAMSLL